METEVTATDVEIGAGIAEAAVEMGEEVDVVEVMEEEVVVAVVTVEVVEVVVVVETLILKPRTDSRVDRSDKQYTYRRWHNSCYQSQFLLNVLLNASTRASNDQTCIGWLA